jgi:hypothetical protein
MEDNSIAILDVAQRPIIGKIKTGNGPARVCVSRDGKTLIYILQNGGKRISRSRYLEGDRPGSASGATTFDFALGGWRDAYLGIQVRDKVAVVSISPRRILRVFDTPSGAGPDAIEPLER